MDEELYKIFMDKVIDSGSLIATCSLCGRKIFATEDESLYELGELEKLRKKLKRYPYEYEEWPFTDSIHSGIFQGKTIVEGCCKERVLEYIQDICNNAEVIAAILNKRAELMRKRAELLIRNSEKIKIN